MDIKENIKQKYLFDMPEDFYQLWEFCKYLKPENPQGKKLFQYFHSFSITDILL